MPTICVFYGVVIQMFAGDSDSAAAFPRHVCGARSGDRPAGLRIGARVAPSPGHGSGAGVGLGSSRRIDGGLEAMRTNAAAEADRSVERSSSSEHRLHPGAFESFGSSSTACWRFASSTVLRELSTCAPSSRATKWSALSSKHCATRRCFSQAELHLGAVEWPGEIDLGSRRHVRQKSARMASRVLD